MAEITSSKPLISVIIPAYNSEETVARAVCSVLDQSYEHLEVVVVDDGSSDGTSRVVRELMEEDSRVRLIQKANGGVSAARNDGIRAAFGTWFVTLDADDYIDPDMLRRLWETAADTEADVVICGFRMVYDNGRKKAFRVEEDYTDDKEEFIDAMFVDLYDRHMISTHSNKLYSMEIVWRDRIWYNERLAVNEDIDFVLRYLRSCRTISVIRGVYLNYVQQETGKSLNTTFQDYGVASSLLVLRDCDALFSDLELSDHTFDRMNNRLLMHICSFVGLMYYRSGYSDEDKLHQLEKLCEEEEFQQLLEDTRPRGLKLTLAHFLLKHGLVMQYHWLCRLFYRSKGADFPPEGSRRPGDDGFDLLDEPRPKVPVRTRANDGIDTELIEAAMREEQEKLACEGDFRVRKEDMEEVSQRLDSDSFSEENL